MDSHKNLVQAIAIDYHYIYTLCCNYKCKVHIHKYESSENISNRYEIRRSHCPCDKNLKVNIRIDNTTKRCKLNYYNNRSITMSRRPFLKEEREIMERRINNKIKKKKREEKNNNINHLIVTFD
jgi:hypothetical protein